MSYYSITLPNGFNFKPSTGPRYDNKIVGGLTLNNLEELSDIINKEMWNKNKALVYHITNELITAIYYNNKYRRLSERLGYYR